MNALSYLVGASPSATLIPPVTGTPSGQTADGPPSVPPLVPDGHEAVVHLTLTDDHPWAQAFIVIEARKL